MTGKYRNQTSLKPIEQQITDAAHCEASRCTNANVEGRRAIVSHLEKFARDLQNADTENEAIDNAVAVLKASGAPEKLAHDMVDRMSDKFAKTSSYEQTRTPHVDAIAHGRKRYNRER